MQSAMQKGLTSIIIVTADSGPTTRACVARALDSDVPVEVILVDNGSSDGEPEAIARARSEDHRLRVVYNRANLGFGAAVNHGARQAEGDHLLILNPDCLLEADTVSRLREALDSHLQGGLVGAVICDEEGEIDPASRRRDPLLHRALATMRGRDRGDGEHARECVYVYGAMPEGVTEEEAVSGALMLLKRRVFERVEGFDTGYFLHCEDLDLCRRVRDAGYEVLLAGQVRVVHAGGSSSRHRPVFVSRHKHAGMWRWFRKFDPAARNPFTALFVWSGLWAHFLLGVPRLIASRRSSG
jgi:N-acetylglucosaminyl-diphospho-decaprenol L-rhamnosyltransferase